MIFAHLVTKFLPVLKKEETWVSYQLFYGGMNLIRHQDLSSLEMTESAAFTSIIEILLLIIQNMQILYGGTLLPKVHLSQGKHRRLGSMSSTMKIKAKMRMRYHIYQFTIFFSSVYFLWFAYVTHDLHELVTF